MISIPTALSQRESEFIKRTVSGQRVIEFGSLLGYSTILMAKVASHIVSVDKHVGYGPSTLLCPFISNLHRFGVAGTVLSITKDVEQLEPIHGDVGFIDLDGSYWNTLVAIRKCLAPTILIHDLNRVRCSGVADAIHDTHLKVVGHIDSLAVCKRF